MDEDVEELRTPYWKTHKMSNHQPRAKAQDAKIPDLRSALVVHTIKTHDGFEEVVQRDISAGVQSHLEERLEDVVKHFPCNNKIKITVKQ